MRRHALRGQTLPVWAFGLLTILALTGLSINYANSVAWQIRAQNAADAAAQGALSIQATYWNTMMADLHAAAVEEYRIRYILRDLDEVANVGNIMPVGSGGCDGSGGATGCAAMYTNLRAQYIAALNRYTQDAQLVQSIDSPTLPSVQAAVQQAIANFQTNCQSATSGGDCAFEYTIIDTSTRASHANTPLTDVYSDAGGDTVGGGTTAPAGLNPSLQPLQVEVVTCATVPSWSFFGLTLPSFVAVGRAAATTMMATQEFLEIGSVVNPLTGNVFQPAEFPESANNQPVGLPNSDQWFRIDFGGNANNAYGDSGNPLRVTDPNNGIFQGSGNQNQAFDAYTGWWTAIAIPPYMGQLSPNQFQCKQN